jgi:tetratricopeptide (TPR) repeat protein
MTDQQERFQQAMNQGHSAAWDQMWERAAGFYRQALDEAPDHPQALTSLGLALYELQDYESALQAYYRAAKANSSDPVPMEKLAQLYERLGNLDQAVQASMNAAELYLRNREPLKAVENWGRITRLQPENLQAHSRLALVYERMQERPKAVAAYVAVASLLQSAGDLEKAMLAVNRALQIAPESEEANQALQLLKMFKPLPKPVRPRGGTAPLRMSQVRLLQSPQPDALPGDDPVAQTAQAALTSLAGMLFDVGEENSVLASVLRGDSRRANRTEVLRHLGQVVDLQTRKQFAEAAADLEQAVAAGLEAPAAYFDLGYLLAQVGRLEDATRYLPLAFNHPDFAMGAFLMAARVERQLNRLGAAALHYLEALRLADAAVVPIDQAEDLRQLYEPLLEAQGQNHDPEQHQLLCDNIDALLMRSDWRTHLLAARDQLPSRDSGLSLPLAEIITEARSSAVIDAITSIYELARQGLYRTAMEEAFYALEQAPTYLPLHSYMGELLLKQDRLNDAQAKFMAVARAYSIRGENNRAVAIYKRLIDLAPMNLDARSSLIEQYVAGGKLDEAINGYLNLAEVYYNLADLDMVRKTYAEALRLAQQPKVDRSMRVKVMHRMADIDLQSLDWRQALRLFEQICKLQPDDEAARLGLIDLNYRLGQENQALAELDNYVSYLSSLGGRDQIMRLLRSLVREHPERVQYRQRLGEAYRQLGRVKEALEQFDAVAQALVKSGDRSGARQIIEAILALNPPNKLDYLQLLERLKS